MIAIVNISKGSPEYCSYEIRINSTVMATFKHKRKDGLAKCLQLAAQAAERGNLEKISGLLRVEQIERRYGKKKHDN